MTLEAKKTIGIIGSALSLVNYLVGGIMGFILVRGENLKMFAFLFGVFVLAGVGCLLADWMTLRQTESEMEYRVLTLRKWRFVREPRRMKRDDNGLLALQMGISGWLFSLMVPLIAVGFIWPDSFWLLSAEVVNGFVMMAIGLSGLVIGLIRARCQRKKGENV
jgi:hypothetical protein